MRALVLSMVAIVGCGGNPGADAGGTAAGDGGGVGDTATAPDASWGADATWADDPRADSVSLAPDGGRADVAQVDGAVAEAGPLPDANVSVVTSLTKDGITWTFSQPVVAGQFVNGDYYVVGPVTIDSISPGPTSAAPYETGRS